MVDEEDVIDGEEIEESDEVVDDVEGGVGGGGWWCVGVIVFVEIGSDGVVVGGGERK